MKVKKVKKPFSFNNFTTNMFLIFLVLIILGVIAINITEEPSALNSLAWLFVYVMGIVVSAAILTLLSMKGPKENNLFGSD